MRPADAGLLPAASPGNGEAARDALPAPEELTARLSPEVVATMDELFRAKWTVVKRVRREDLKDG